MKKAILFFWVMCSLNIYSQNIPAGWSTIKDNLYPRLKKMNDTLDILTAGKKYNTNYCTNLILANSNRGYELIDPKTQPALLNAIDKNLDALKYLGIKGVDVTIQYPILVNTFSNYDKYLSFYKAVFSKIRSKGLKIIQGIEATFIDTVWTDSRLVSDLKSFYTGLNSTRFKTEKKQMIQTILSELQPDYLELENEPATQTYNLMNLVDFSPASIESYVRYYLEGLNKGSTIIGAGSGNWETMEYFTRLASIQDLDALSIHIYPVNGSLFLDKVFKIGNLANLNNKKVLIMETTLYKESDSELSGGSNVAMSSAIYSRDGFTYWKTVDSLFATALVKYSSLYEVPVTNYFWQHHFFQYVDYSSQTFGSMTGGEIMSYMEHQGYQNSLVNNVSWFGNLFKNLIAANTNGTEGINKIPSELILSQNYPNPFNPSTIIKYSVPQFGKVKLSVFDLLGREITVLVNEERSPGNYEVQFNAGNLSSGIYLYKLETNNLVRVKKMSLLK